MKSTCQRRPYIFGPKEGPSFKVSLNYYYYFNYVCFRVCVSGCFLVWMIVTTNAGPQYRDPAVAIANLVNASLLLIFMPLRKLHLLCLARSEKDLEPYNCK